MGIMRRRMRRRAVVGGAAAAAVAYHAGKRRGQADYEDQGTEPEPPQSYARLPRRNLCPTGIHSTNSGGWANCTPRGS